MTAKIFVGFPGMGRTMASEFEAFNIKGCNVLDLDTTQFRIRPGKIRNNPLFPSNLEERILEDMVTFKLMLLPSEKEIYEILERNKIEYTAIYPSLDIKEDYYKNHHEHKEFGDYLGREGNYEDYFNNIKNLIDSNDDLIGEFIELQEDKYMSDFMYQYVEENPDKVYESRIIFIDSDQDPEE